MRSKIKTSSRMMATGTRAIALGHKLLGISRIRAPFSTIHQRSASSARPPPRGKSEEEQAERHPWDFQLSKLTAQLILTGSTLCFMLYFFVLRDESDVDTAIYRPIWERVPGISPEVAERMLEVDKQMGILYDAKEWEKSLREYKQRYYANHPDKRP